jgi:hypothetical protein
MRGAAALEARAIGATDGSYRKLAAEARHHEVMSDIRGAGAETKWKVIHKAAKKLYKSRSDQSSNFLAAIGCSLASSQERRASAWQVDFHFGTGASAVKAKQGTQ